MPELIQLLAILALPALAGCASTEGGYPPGYYSGGGYHAPYVQRRLRRRELVWGPLPR